MLKTLLALIVLAQPPQLTSADVGGIVTALLIDSVQGTRPMIRAVRGRPLVVDLEGSNRAFERYSGRSLAVARASWLPGVEFRSGTLTEALDCPTGTSVVTSRCRVRGNAVWVNVYEVTAGDVPGEILVKLHVLWTHRVPNGDSFMGGFTTQRGVRRTNGGWSTTRILWTAA